MFTVPFMEHYSKVRILSAHKNTRQYLILDDVCYWEISNIGYGLLLGIVYYEEGAIMFTMQLFVTNLHLTLAYIGMCLLVACVYYWTNSNSGYGLVVDTL